MSWDVHVLPSCLPIYPNIICKHRFSGRHTGAARMGSYVYGRSPGPKFHVPRIYHQAQGNRKSELKILQNVVRDYIATVPYYLKGRTRMLLRSDGYQNLSGGSWGGISSKSLKLYQLLQKTDPPALAAALPSSACLPSLPCPIIHPRLPSPLFAPTLRIRLALAA